jgi:HD-GYP domain-containing protein (c-di-GMP phosphodiesterase class II)
MKPKSPLKDIAIDQLTPGMFVAEMDLPWYRTPFLFHKRLVKDAETIRLMKQHGIRRVTIDTSKGRDLPAQPANRQAFPADGRSPGRQEGGGDSVEFPADAPPDPAAGGAGHLYAEAQQTVDRIFADLEQGLPPPPAATKAVVSRILSHVLRDRAGLMTQLALAKVKQFDRSLAGHGLDTCILSLVVAVECGLGEDRLEQLGIGALLHDAGYVRLPRNVVRRRWDCTDAERALLEQHPALGLALLGDQPDLREEVTRIVAEHHERGDGSGFPAKLAGDAISQAAQIVGLVDVYDGMVSRRSGRPAMLPHDAIRQLFLAGERGQFEKALVEIVIRSIGVYPVGSLVRLNTGEQAVVVGVNPEQRLKPRVKITGGPQGEFYPDPIDLDLAAQAQDGGARSVLRVVDPTQERVNIAMYLDDPPSKAA